MEAFAGAVGAFVFIVGAFAVTVDPFVRTAGAFTGAAEVFVCTAGAFAGIVGAFAGKVGVFAGIVGVFAGKVGAFAREDGISCPVLGKFLPGFPRRAPGALAELVVVEFFSRCVWSFVHGVGRGWWRSFWFPAVFGGMAAPEDRVSRVLATHLRWGLKALDVKAWAEASRRAQAQVNVTNLISKACKAVISGRLARPALSGRRSFLLHCPGAARCALHPRLSHSRPSAWSTAEVRKPVPP